MCFALHSSLDAIKHNVIYFACIYTVSEERSRKKKNFWAQMAEVSLKVIVLILPKYRKFN